MPRGLKYPLTILFVILMGFVAYTVWSDANDDDARISTLEQRAESRERAATANKAGLKRVESMFAQLCQTAPEEAIEDATVGLQCNLAQRGRIEERLPPGPTNQTEVDEPEIQEFEQQERERQQIERQDREFQNPEINELEAQEAEEQEAEIQDEEEQEAEEQEPEVQEEEIQEPEEQEAEVQEPETDNPDPNSQITGYVEHYPDRTVTCERRPNSPDTRPEYDCTETPREP